MRIMLSAHGTRGDIQPLIPLGVRLRGAGHEVLLCAAGSYRPAVAAHAVPFAPLSSDLVDLSQALMRGAGSPRQGLTTARQLWRATRHAMDDEWAAAAAFQPEVMVYHPKLLESSEIAERLDIPAFATLALPFLTPTGEFPVPVIASRRLGRRLNRWTYQFQRAVPLVYGGMINDFRVRTLGLRALSRFADPSRDWRGERIPVLYSHSRHVVPIPSDFPPSAHVTGYWFLNADLTWRPDSALTRFLAAGPPPVYVGFGSMIAGGGARARTEMIVAALAVAGRRGILARGWGGLAVTDLPEHVHVVDDVPHDWLFPQVAAVVHHGGSGTTAAGLRAGRPTLVCPVLGDQPFWGKAVHRLGAGPAPIPLTALTVPNLTQALTALTSMPEFLARAGAVGEALRAEDEPGNAIRVLEQQQLQS